MTTSTRTFNKVKSEKRRTYGELEFLKFQKAIQTLNLEKDEYWQHSNFNFLNKIEKKQAHTLLIPSKKETQQQQQLDLTEKISELLANLTTSPQTEVKPDFHVLTFVNGLLALDQSRLHSKDIILETTATSINKLYPQALNSLVRHPHHEENLMLQLNAALCSLQEGHTEEQQETFIRIRQDANLHAPLILLFLDDTSAKEKVLTPRIHLHVEPNAALTLLELHSTETPLLQNTFFNITLAEGAKTTHIQELNEGASVNHTHLTHGTFHKNSSYHSFVMQRGSQSSILEKTFSLIGAGAQVVLRGLGMGKNRQHFNNIISLHHETEQTTSRQDYKFILDGHARAGFTGNVKVYPQAQAVQSEQLCKTLLLGEKAVMYTRPQLEIFADDVKCGHGATIGQVNPEELFYLMSRGLSSPQALSILSYAFVKEFFMALMETLSSAEPFGKVLTERNLPKIFF